MKAIHKEDEPAAETASGGGESQLQTQSLLEHLRELRKMLMLCGGAVLACFLIIFFMASEPLVSFLTRSLSDRGIAIIYTNLTETFAVQIKASLLAGCILAAPVILWQVWSFVVPALYKKEKRLFTALYASAIVLFVIGVLFAYIVVFNMAVNFFVMYGENLAVPMISINTYVDFLISFVLPFGVVFELPIAVIVLIRMELITVETLTKNRKYMIFGAFLIGAIMTPPDVLSQVMLGLPLIALYELGIIIAKVMAAPKKKQSGA